LSDISILYLIERSRRYIASIPKITAKEIKIIKIDAESAGNKNFNINDTIVMIKTRKTIENTFQPFEIQYTCLFSIIDLSLNIYLLEKPE